MGLRCPGCAGVASSAQSRGIGGLVRPLAVGLAVALPIALVMGLWPQWNFYLGLVLGFASAEMMARSAPGRRGPEMQVLAVAVVLVALAFSRYVTASTLGLELTQLDFTRNAVQRALYLRPMPDLVFAGIPLLIAFFRFR